MTSTRNLKRASIPSIVAIILCFAMLLGTTYAWFTDTVTSSGNAISTGDFQVALQILDDDNTTWTDTAAHEENGAATTANTPIFAEQNWEPGASSVVKVLRVVNEGTIDMKWKAQIIDGGTKDKDGNTAAVALADVIDVYYAWDVDAYPVGDVTTTWTKIGTLTQCINGLFSSTIAGVLTGDDDDATDDTFKTFGIALKMQETATSEYENLTASFDVKIISTQAVATEWPGENNAQAPTTSATNTATGVTAAAVDAPAGVKLADSATELVLNVANATTENANVTIQNGQSRIDLDIDLEGLATDNTTPVTVTLTIDKNLENVVLYHNGEQITSNYDPATGILTFQTATFSPFTVVYGEIEEEPEVTEPEPEVTEPEPEVTEPEPEVTEPEPEVTEPEPEVTEPEPEVTEPEPEETEPEVTEPETDPDQDGFESFTSNVASNELNTELKNTDLANFFTTINYADANENKVVNTGPLRYRLYNGELRANVSAPYAISVNNYHSNHYKLFVRSSNSDNMLRENWSGDGIQVRFQDTNILVIQINSYENGVSVASRFTYSVLEADNNGVLTIADNGENIYVLVNDTVYATISLSGTKTYDGLDGEFVDTATVTYKDGTVKTYTNTLIDTDSSTSIGIATINSIEFTELSVKPFSDVASKIEE